MKYSYKQMFAGCAILLSIVVINYDDTTKSNEVTFKLYGDDQFRTGNISQFQGALDDLSYNMTIHIGENSTQNITLLLPNNHGNVSVWKGDKMVAYVPATIKPTSDSAESLGTPI
jgi:hypothetical protein